jgi:cytochrome c oxidase subunit 1
MHGTIMVFLAIVPLLTGAFGNYVMPLQIGAPDMAFPRLNMMSYQFYFFGGVIMFASFFVPGGAAKSGWTSYSPLSSITDMGHHPNGQTFWLIGMVFLITSSLLGSINIITTIIQLRAKGLTWMRLPFFVWAQFVTGFLLLLAFPPLEAAGCLQLMDNAFGTSFFLPSGLVVSGQKLHIAGGGSPLLWQHLFWFLAHPEVYVLVLPAMGIVAEVIANNTRKPLWGYRSLVYASLVLGFLSFVVWAHHMYLTGMGIHIATFFQTTTMMISIPSVIILTALLISLYGGSIRFNTPMLFAVGFLPMFGIGGLTGLPLGFNASDIQLHDSYYVIGHFHYVVAPGTIFAIFAGIYYWYPKATGRFMNEYWGKVHFVLSFLFMNLIFMPMFIQGLAGMSRRMYDGGVTYLAGDGVAGLSPFIIHLNKVISFAAFSMAVSQIPFIINFFWSIKNGKKVPNDNPWDATTLEWQTPTPPGHGNFDKPIEVFRGPYEYSVPDHAQSYLPQNDPDLEHRLQQH